MMLISHEDTRMLIKGTVDKNFRADVLEGMASSPREIPARWFYDRRGSELFEAITALPEYYPTRSERSILLKYAGEIAAMAGPGRAVVEFGSGSSAKTPLLLSAISPSAYVPIDISGDFLRESAQNLGKMFPSVPVFPIEGDFTHPVALPPGIQGTRSLGFFPGSTIGNLLVPAAVDLLRAMAETLGEDSMLLIGIDRIKDPAILIPAYDDQQGVTAEFNLNLLCRINRELDGTIPVEAFRHLAKWNDDHARIEMHLEALYDVDFTIEGYDFSMRRGETIHTENSHKYGPRDVDVLLRAGGWQPLADWTDVDGQFGVILAATSRSGASLDESV
ncbi:L-histidine N(alpha)-methyltransferase [Undibacterium sp. TJN25]|uniref:L-histidine N(alpha)-methyltransferase n=1 Tax=Undibacterium sp. TJN25 TaxID=3413056 RepID=UPI003BF0EF11